MLSLCLAENSSVFLDNAVVGAAAPPGRCDNAPLGEVAPVNWKLMTLASRRIFFIESADILFTPSSSSKSPLSLSPAELCPRVGLGARFEAKPLSECILFVLLLLATGCRFKRTFSTSLSSGILLTPTAELTLLPDAAVMSPFMASAIRGEVGELFTLLVTELSLGRRSLGDRL